MGHTQANMGMLTQECGDGLCAAGESVACPQDCVPRSQSPTFPNKLYLFFPQLLTWSKARDFCKTFGGDLASVRNAEEQDTITILNGQNNQRSTGWGYGYAYIGMNDINQEGVFVWSDGSPTTYTNWYPSNPSGGVNENCVHLDHSPLKGVYDFSEAPWNDVSCEDWAFPFICGYCSNGGKLSNDCQTQVSSSLLIVHFLSCFTSRIM
jgi:hypothetical protein